MSHGVGKLKVEKGIGIDIGTKVVVVVGKLSAKPMIQVEHARDPVKTKAIKTVLLQPVANVGEQETLNIDLGVVEAQGIPGFMIATRTIVEVLIGRAIKAGQPLQNILDRMAVHQVHQDPQAKSVRLGNQSTEIVWCSKPTGDPIE